MKLTARNDSQRIKRYSHIKPARGWRVDVCGTSCPGTGHTCTREKSHRGPHVSHGWFGRVVAVWDADTAVRASTDRMRTALRASSRRELRKTPPAGTLSSLLSRVGRLVGSVDQVVFLILLLAFIGFAIQWFLLVRG